MADTNSALELLRSYEPPADLREVFAEIARSLAQSMERGGPVRERKIRRHAAQMARQLEDVAMLCDVTAVADWQSLRTQVTSPAAAEEICLWLVAVGWRLVALLDGEKELTDDELDDVHQLAIEGNATARALPTTYRMRAEELLREDFREDQKVPGPVLRPAGAGDTLHYAGVASG